MWRWWKGLKTSVYDSDSYYEGYSLSPPRTHHTPTTSTDTPAQSSSHRVSGNRPPTVQTNLHSAPICPKVTKRRSQVLDSAALHTHQLISPDDVTAANWKIAKPSKVGPFSVKLAREAFFWDDVLAKCTVFGCRDYPGLPPAELQALKQCVSPCTGATLASSKCCGVTA